MKIKDYHDEISEFDSSHVAYLNLILPSLKKNQTPIFSTPTKYSSIFDRMNNPPKIIKLTKGSAVGWSEQVIKCHS